ncbi:MAG TPA: copper resistance protein NlpE N-terminal domain-containing protein [Candidatus Acidoferrum sp.]|nr:copper resistance protein NlpE N-terminal domain-containing protein [Candidatus Acidoferrum sp.]
MRRIFISAPLVILAALVGLTSLHAQALARDSFKVPATFTATVPCADCPGIHESLTFLPGGLYIDRLVYEERPSTFQSLGRWQRKSDLPQIEIHSGSSPADTYAIVDRNHIRKLAPEGSNVPAIYLPTFTRTATAALPSASFSLSGEYNSKPGESSLTECRSGFALPVSPTGDAPALDHAYQAANLKPDSQLLVSVTGTIALRPGNKSALLIVNHFQHSWPGNSCASPVE